MNNGPAISDPEKLRGLQEIAALHASHPHVVEAARTIRDLVSHKFGLRSVQGDRLTAAIIHTIARDGIRYQLDTARVGHEDIAGVTRPDEHPFAVLRRGVDDCDAKASLFVSLARAAGLEAEIVPLWRGPVLQHVFARVRIGGAWLPVELTLARARLGDEPFSVPFEKDKPDWKRT